MSLENLLRTVGETVTRRAHVESLFGHPLQVGERTLIPVARVQYGFGGGDNDGVMGSGGGMEAVPVGVVEVSPEGVRFHAFPNVERPVLLEVRPGVHRLRECWLLVHGSQAAIVNAPPDASLAPLLLEQVGRLGVEVRSLLATSGDYRVVGGMPDLQRVFPEARLVLHEDLAVPGPAPEDPEAWRSHLPPLQADVTFADRLWVSELDGEPLLVTFTRGRHQVVFRGTALAQGEDDVEELLGDAYRVERWLPA